MSNHRPRPRVLAALAVVFLGLAPALPGATTAIAAQNAPASPGYWFVAADGGIFSFGDANFYGSTGSMRLNQPIVGMAPTPTGRGYWFVAADGGIFSFGDANFYGSTGNLRLNKPIVGMAATPTGRGYWFVASDGGIFAFGDAKFYGSMGASPQRSPIVGMTASPTGKGYWFVAGDGSIFSFGDAGFLGSMGGRPLTLPVVGMSPTSTGQGYWLVASDGGIFSFGDARFHGSTGDIRLNQPIVGMAPVAPGQGSTSPAGPGATTTTRPSTTPTTAGPGPTPTTVPPTTPTTTPPSGVSWGGSGTTTRLAGGGGSGAFRPWMSGDGRFVAFDSGGTRVVSGDTNGVRDVFVYDRVSGGISRVSVASGGAQANGQSQRPTISADGRFVAFWSDATNLVSGDTNNVADAFLHDRQEGTTIRVSAAPSGAQGNGESKRPVISRDGRFVAFESAARNLVESGVPLPIGGTGGDTNNARDIFVHELATRRTTRVSVASGGAQANGESVRPTISGNGRLVAFQSDAANLVTGDTNAKTDVFLHDLDSGQTTRVSVAADGTEASQGSLSPSISADGRFVAFDTGATNLGVEDTNRIDDIYVKDRQTGAVSRASVATGGIQAQGDPSAGPNGSHDSSISGDGRFVAFWSEATNLVAGDTNGFYDAFVHDRQTGTTVRVSVATSGAQGNNNTFSPALSVDGRFVAFDSKASNLATDDTTTTGQDVFVYAM